ncbi:[protein-PII] uridylyltransferase [Thioalkalivibrio paradoxus]|uniref:Bifunctional uridylyltransferase/uridylyl-removing enzyme n=1 Tax=Thioalkalivibrio paradoxus ARh 1 TaxID=713585 RepID=W0DNM3_9GAMM|nr:[protein-PII] uridylyltransferase [Thioalkalivibrio paradoxus]AHE98603.1 PII uridylyl-transferase [Thioalkalivibrio paradoxus ARh 1]
MSSAALAWTAQAASALPGLEELRAHPLDAARFRQFRRDIIDRLHQGFHDGADIDALIHGHAAQIDSLLTLIWRQFELAAPSELCLVAVGGYGRGELHPGSDIDILVLAERDAEARHGDTISRFVTFLWDIGLEVGHSVRSIDDCLREAGDDITIATTMFEARHLCGARALFETFREAMQPERIWDSRSFYAAKLAEQQARHQRFGETAYRLEPNVKEGPGGLRDIQMIGWVSKRHFAAERLEQLVAHGFLREGELRDLIAGQRFLWKVRFALHMITGRREDRLLFDLQRALASTFGFVDQRQNLGVEQFMQRYFRTISDLQRLNELLLQHFNEAILQDPGSMREVQRIHQRFQIRGGYLELVHDQVFMIYPPALLEAFLLVQTHPEVQGIRASTIRLIRAHRHMIDGQFRRNPVCRNLFMQILRAPRGVTTELRRMNRYGVLGAYIPAFGRIIGRMQYDLFHAYTVDEHTLHVVRNARRFALREFGDEQPLASEIYSRVQRPERLILAALFHDIAKGRGGDHSELGALDALHFCQHHGLGDDDAALVSWLVRSHLLMSLTAQRKDISDPEVVLGFAREVRTRERLDLLYLLTIADIRGTNPELWNNWKASLLQTLYKAALLVLERGLDTPPDTDEQIGQTCREALQILASHGLDEETVEAIWEEFEVEYFLRHSADEIAWHTRAIAGIRDTDLPLVLVRHETPRGSTEIFVYTDDHPRLFARITTTLTQLGLDIVDARIITTHGGRTLDTFLVLEGMGHAVEPGFRVDEIRETLRERLVDPRCDHHAVQRSLPRRLKHFDVVTQIEFSAGTPPGTSTRMRVRALDRPGLLSTIGCVFAEQNVNVRTARISTAGEQVEDIFLLFNADGRELTPEQQHALRRQLIDEI